MENKVILYIPYILYSLSNIYAMRRDCTNIFLIKCFCTVGLLGEKSCDLFQTARQARFFVIGGNDDGEEEFVHIKE